MTEDEWRQRLGELVRESEQSEARQRFYGIRLTKARAQLDLLQISLFVRYRRDCWANVSANCSHFPVKHKILEHEYEEVIRDEYSDHGHLDLTMRQAKSIDLSPEDVIKAVSIPATRVALYSWGWLTRMRPWAEGLGVLMVTEMINDNRLLEDLGGGGVLKKTRKWMEELGLSLQEIPDSAAHSKADERHSEMFLPSLANYVRVDQEAGVLEAAGESLELRELMTWGICEAMERLS